MKRYKKLFKNIYSKNGEYKSGNSQYEKQISTFTHTIHVYSINKRLNVNYMPTPNAAAPDKPMNKPAMAADIKLDNEPAITALIPSLAIS